mgnify:CR=1 FL=1
MVAFRRVTEACEVKKDYFQSTLLPLVIIPVGGLLTLAACYLLYLFIYNTVESWFFPTDPTSVPADIMRRVYALALLISYVVLLRTKISDIIKSAILAGPMGFFLTTSYLAFYETPVLAIVVIGVIVAVSIFLLYKYRKPWIYYYALATLLALIPVAWSGA